MWPFLAFGVNEAIGDVQGREGEPALFALQFLAWLLFPSQGMLNAIVYFRESYNRWRLVSRGSSRCSALYHCVVTGQVPRELIMQGRTMPADHWDQEPQSEQRSDVEATQ